MLTKEQIHKLQRARRYGLGRMLLLARKDFLARLLVQLSADGDPAPPPAGGALLPFIDLEGTRSSELARRMGVSKQAVGKAVKELEDAGLVTRAADGADRRAFLVAFTVEGVDYLLRIHDAIDAVERQYTGLVGAQEVEALRGLLAAMVYPGEAST